MQNDVEKNAMAGQPRRIRREMKTVGAMIRIFCEDTHNSPRGSLCSDCEEMLDYALARLTRCPFSSEKPACSKCLIHCYQANRREQVRRIMRYAGPRMLRRHPLLAIRHLLDGSRKPPCREERDRIQK